MRGALIFFLFVLFSFCSNGQEQDSTYLQVYRAKDCFNQYLTEIETLQEWNVEQSDFTYLFYCDTVSGLPYCKMIVVDRHFFPVKGTLGVFEWNRSKCYLIGSEVAFFFERSNQDSVAVRLSGGMSRDSNYFGRECTTIGRASQFNASGNAFFLFFQPLESLSRRQWRKFKKMDFCE